MRISIEKTEIEDLYCVIPEIFKDQRGFFLEVFRTDVFQELGLPTQFVQFNHSGSIKNVLRGMHFQWDPPMGKLMRVARGSAFLVAVDIRRDSPTLGRWHGIKLGSEEKKMIWAPAGFARGFAVLSDFAEIEYMATGVYNPAHESGILWNDPEVGIRWPVANPILSSKDATAQSLSQWLAKPESRNLVIQGRLSE